MTSEDASKLFVAGLSESITENVLRQLFEATGSKVVDVSLPRDRMTGTSRGFGFVTLASSEEAATARSALDGSIQDGRAISVRPFSGGKRGEVRPGGGGIAPTPRAPEKTLYVGNLPYDVGEDELKQLFSDKEVGPVGRIHLPIGQDGRPRGFGFISLAGSVEPQAAADALNGADLRGRPLVVNVAQPRGERPAGASQSPSGYRGAPQRASGDSDMSRRAPPSGGAAPFDPELPDRGPEGRRSRGVEGKKKKKEKEKAARTKPERAEAERKGGKGNWQWWQEIDEE